MVLHEHIKIHKKSSQNLDSIRLHRNIFISFLPVLKYLSIKAFSKFQLLKRPAFPNREEVISWVMIRTAACAEGLLNFSGSISGFMLIL